MLGMSSIHIVRIRGDDSQCHIVTCLSRPVGWSQWRGCPLWLQRGAWSWFLSQQYLADLLQHYFTYLVVRTTWWKQTRKKKKKNVSVRKGSDTQCRYGIVNSAKIDKEGWHTFLLMIALSTRKAGKARQMLLNQSKSGGNVTRVIEVDGFSAARHSVGKA